ncbi:Kinesin-like protein KIF22-B [Hordeum vulgare]|nr:Kinesin-like protein KIF22-B [Hordeum vulgare]
MVLDDKLGNLQLKVLAWAPVRSAEEFQEIYLIGVQSRKSAHTGLNDVSCRSHDVLSITVSNDTVKGRLNLIDLSGTEDNRKTCNEGILLQESSRSILRCLHYLMSFQLSRRIMSLKYPIERVN